MSSMTRRQFACAMASIVVAGTAPLARRPLNLGIGTYTYHNLSIDDMIAQLIRLKITEIEMSRGEFMLFSRPTPNSSRQSRRSSIAQASAVWSYYSATIKNDADLENALRFAALLGATNVTGDATGGMLQRIDERFSQAGLTFGIHNHYFKEKFAYESADDVLKALAGRSQAMGASLDVGHIASCGFDTVDAVRRLAPYLKMVHLKDVKASGGEVNVLLGPASRILRTS